MGLKRVNTGKPCLDLLEMQISQTMIFAALTRAFRLNKNPRSFLGQIRCTKQILGVGGPSASRSFPLLLFSSVPSLDGGEGGRNNGFCGDAAGFLLDTWLEEPRRASYGASS